jgi:hypothetical protein
MKSTTRILALLAFLALAACDGTALVTLTATPATTLTATPGSVNGFLTYRVTLVSVALQQSSGSASQNVLPSPVSIDLVQSTNFSEILGSSSVTKGTYTGVTVTLDYSNAVIVYDNDTLAGMPLKPQFANGQGAGQISLSLQFDPASPLVITKGNTSQLSLDFLLSASNSVNPTAASVTVNPVLAASTLPIDTKLGRLRGLLSGATADITSSSTSASTSATTTTTGTYTTGIKPFDGLVSGAGSMSVSPTPTTIFEINGTPAIGTAGITAMAALSPGTWTVAYGTLASTTNTTTIPVTTTPDTTDTSDGSTSVFGTTGDTTSTDTNTIPLATSFTTTTSVSFTPTQILAGSSVQGGGYDRISGVVTARNGNALTVPSATWTTSAGVTSYVHGTTTITGGPGTAIILPAQAAVQANSGEQVSVGSVIDAFGTATEGSSGLVSLDVSKGRVRLENTVASGLVTNPGTGLLTVNLSTLGGRLVIPPDPFNFGGTNSVPTNYVASTSDLDLTNSIAGTPVELTGLTALYGAGGNGQPDFIATLLLDSTTINAELVLDWGGSGSAMPFAQITTSELDLLSTGIVPGLRHQIAIGAQTVEVPIAGSDVLIEASAATTVVYSIAHASTSTVENFNTFAAFAAQLQNELNGTTVVTLITADGIYTEPVLAATSVTVDLSI